MRFLFSLRAKRDTEHCRYPSVSLNLSNGDILSYHLIAQGFQMPSEAKAQSKQQVLILLGTVVPAGLQLGNTELSHLIFVVNKPSLSSQAA